MKAFVFPGQGAQFVGMGKDLYENSALAKELFEKANDILGYRITDIMFDGTDEDLRQTKVTQPAVFLHSVISALCMGDDFKPEMTAGHSLGEFSALVAAGALSFEDGLKLVYARAMAMQKACEATPSTMAAIIALPDEKVEEICAAVNAEGEVCVPANYNCPGQIVISGSVPGIEKACELMKAAGAKRALPLKVGGAFHSPLMDPAKIELEAAIKATEIHTPKCPVYQNADALPHTDPAEIKKNLVAQLTASVRWTQSVKNMVADGATDFTECGPGAVLQGLIKKIDGTVNAEHEIFMGDLPIMTATGTFVINGAERVIVSQLVRSPGIYYEIGHDKVGKELFSCTVIPNRGAWLEYETDANDVFSVRVDRTRKVPVTVLIRALGYGTNAQIIDLFGEEPKIMASLAKDTSDDYQSGLLELYKKIRPGEPLTVESAESLISAMFFDPRRYDLAKVGRYKFNKKLLLRNRICGQVLAEDVVDESTGEILAEAGTEVDKALADKIQNAGVPFVWIQTEQRNVKVLSNMMVDLGEWVDFDPESAGVTELVYYPVLQKILEEN